jgi:dihydrofolate reductase
MAKLIYEMMVSLDGFISTPDGGLDWVVIDEELHTFVNNQQSEIGAELYGRRMYELMAEYWPTGDADPSAPAYEAEFARIWRDMPKVVFSKTLERVDWNSRLDKGDAVEEVKKLKEQPGKDLAVSGAEIAGSLIREGLVDEIRLFVNPVVLGAGKPMFPALDSELKLRLLEIRRFGSGVVYLRYERDGGA